MFETRNAHTVGERRAEERATSSRPLKWVAVLLLLASIPIGSLVIARPKAGTASIAVLAGTGLRDTQSCSVPPCPGDGGPATAADLYFPRALAVDRNGNVFIGESSRIRRVTPQGVISTIAGGSTQGFSGDGGPATAALFGVITDLEFDAIGNLIVADRGNDRIRRITPSGTVTTIAGSGAVGFPGYGGDGGPATSARFNMPNGIAVGPGGTLYVADQLNQRIRKIDAAGTITTVAGNGVSGFSADGTLAASATLNFPEDVAVDQQGRVIFSDTRNSTVRRIEVDGRLSTIVGGGSFSQDPVATSIALNNPRKLAIDPAGNLLVVNDQKLMRVSAQGRFEILAGTIACDEIDCRAALDTFFSGLQDVAVGNDGAIYVTDDDRSYVHRIAGYPAPAAPVGVDAFEAPRSLATGSNANAVVVGDVNADGRDDVVVATTRGAGIDPSDHHLFIFLQQPGGLLAAPIKRPYLRTAAEAGLALGDMNNDGVRDIVVGHDHGLTFFAGGGASPFNGVPYASVSAAHALMLTDTNGDGNLDVLTMAEGGTRAAILLGNGRLGIMSATQGPAVANASASIVAGDYDDDGWTDYATASVFGFNVLTRGTAGVFSAGPLVQPAAGPANGPRGLFSGDLNGDGRDDLGYQDDGPARTLWLHPQRVGSGLDVSPQTIPTSAEAAHGRVVDLNGDGRNDLVQLHRNSGFAQESLGIYLTTTGGLAQEVHYLIPTGSFDRAYSGHQVMDVGDLDSDGCPDVAIANDQVGLVVMRTRSCLPRTGIKADLVGDGTAEILWRNGSGGQSQYWRSARAGGAVNLTTVTDTQWKALLLGDFDGDGRADLFWRHGSSGANAIWKGGNHTNQQVVTGVTGAAWKVMGAGDFDGDGKDDLLWRNLQTGANTIWRSASYARQLPVTGITDLKWEIAGVDDFNGDGRADILWRHALQGRNTIWLSGNSATQQAVSTTVTSWRIAGVGDLNNDRRADIVWRNSVSGANVVWRGAMSTQVDDITDVTATSWRVAAVADYDGDGRDDLLWRNDVSGANAIWKAGRYANQLPVNGLALSWSAVD